MRKIGIFGSAFDPVHIGHRDAYRQACAEFDSVIFVPSISHPFGKQMTSFHHRALMVERFIAEFLPHDLSSGRVGVSRAEEEIRREKDPAQPIFTFDVLEHFEDLFCQEGGRVSLRFIAGPDNAAAWNQFYRAADIVSRWGLFVARESVPVRSTKIRALAGELAAHPDVLYDRLIPLTGKAVARYIIQERLYYGGTQ